MLTGPGTGSDAGPRATPPPAARTAFRTAPFLVLLATIRRALQRPPRLWQEAVLLVLGFGLYSMIQDDVPLQAHAAYDRGRTLLDLEQRWHIDLLHPLNRALPKFEPLAVLANYYYVAMHFMVPICILLWLIFRHIDRYRAERRAFVLMALIGLAVFWFAPTAPPRLIPGSGVLDTVSHFHTIGSYESGPTKVAADQFASMPSLHFAFALWCAITMFRTAKHRGVRYAWLIYPVLTGLDVLATGNHYVLDLPAGAAALGLGYLISYAASRWARRLDFVPLPDPDADPDPLSPADLLGSSDQLSSSSGPTDRVAESGESADESRVPQSG